MNSLSIITNLQVYLILLYPMFFLTTLIHEIGHYILCILHKIQVNEFCIGSSSNIVFKLKKVKIILGWNVLEGYISINSKEIKPIVDFQITIGGILFNIITFFIFLEIGLNNHNMLSILFAISNLVSAISCWFSESKSSDGFTARKLIREIIL